MSALRVESAGGVRLHCRKDTPSVAGSCLAFVSNERTRVSDTCGWIPGSGSALTAAGSIAGLHAENSATAQDVVTAERHEGRTGRGLARKRLRTKHGTFAAIVLRSARSQGGTRRRRRPSDNSEPRPLFGWTHLASCAADCRQL